MKKILLPIAALTTAFAAGQALAETSVTIGTGGATGVYYQVGLNVCKLVTRADLGINCTAPSTDGSIANINGIAAGNYQFGVVQSDWQYHAVNGTSRFADAGPDSKLRYAFALYPEPFTVVARADAGVKTFSDLKGKRVNIGSPGSGTRGTMEELMAGLGWTNQDFKQATELKPAEMAKALCDGNIDVMTYAVGSPNGSISEATTVCDANLVSLDDAATAPVVKNLVDSFPYYSNATIAGNIYRNNPNDTQTFGVGAVFVTSSDVPDDVVYAITKAVFENLDRFKSYHQAFGNLNPDNMVSDFRSAPLHPGAEKYFREVGLIK